jgi:formylglycine-generating enzyme required for sulfatase activity
MTVLNRIFRWAVLFAVAVSVSLLSGSSSWAVPIVDNSGGAGNITGTSADLNGNLLSDGGFSPVDCYFYYGTTDGGTNKGSWDNFISVGPMSLGPFLWNVSGLTTNTFYYYRTYATNSTGEAWAPASTNFTTTATAPDGPWMVAVSGGAQPLGPSYSFQASVYEIQNSEFVRFLNDAEMSPLSDRGTNMFFAPNGDVFFAGSMSPSEYLFQINQSRIAYNSSNTVGMRYSTTAPLEPHPVVGVTWYGALKYCNWLTIDKGMAPNERCYLEGGFSSDWRPVTATNWPTFSGADRQNWLAYEGFRLPMDDNQATASGYNEYYLLAAWDGSANRQYGFGRDTISAQDANYNAEIWGLGTQPGGFFNGSNTTTNGVTTTLDTQNAWGLYDVSGNVAEWVNDLDIDGGTQYTIRGGHYEDTPLQLQVNQRVNLSPINSSSNIGFRVVSTFIPASGGMNLDIQMPPFALTGTPQTIVITAIDPNGNIDTNYTGTINFQSTDFSASFPGDYTFSTGDMGQKVFSNAFTFFMQGEHMVSVQDTNNFLFSSIDVHVLGGGATNTTRFYVDSESIASVVGAWAPMVVVAMDDSGRVDTGYTGPLSFSSTDTGASFGSAGFVDGFAYLTNGVQFATAGQQTVLVTDAGNTNISGSIDFQVFGGGSVYFVRRNGSDLNTGLAVSNAFQSINYGLSFLSPGDTLIVGGGLYTETLMPVSSGTAGNYITIYGDPDGRYTGDNQPVVIKPGGTNSGFYSSQNYISVVNMEFHGEGFYQGGVVGVNVGGANNVFIGNDVRDFDKGFYLFGANDTLIQDNIIENNFGPGVFLQSGSDFTMIIDNDIRLNYDGVFISGASGVAVEQNFIESNYGAAVRVNPGTAVIKSNYMDGNEDGVAVQNTPTMADIKHNFILNTMTNGILLESADVGITIENNTLYQNTFHVDLINTPGATVINNIMAVGSGTGFLTDAISGSATTNDYNLVFGNTTDWGGSTLPGPNSLNLDPLFASTSPGSEDFHLQSVAGRWSFGGFTNDFSTSPAIDAGYPGSPFSNESSPNGGRINMGAYGNTPEASLSPITFAVDSPYGVSTPVAGTNSYPAGTFISADIFGTPFNAGSTQYVAAGWAGTGDVPASGTGTNLSFVLNNNSTLTWLWETQVFINVGIDPNGAVDVGNAYFTQGTNILLTATPSNGYEFVGWTGDIVTNLNPLSLIVSDALFLVPNFALLTNSLTINSDWGVPNPGIGTQWLPQGTPVAAELGGSPHIMVNTQFVSLGWTATGSAPVSGAGTNVSFTLTNDTVITWNWQTQVFLNVAFDPNGAVDVGSGYYIQGTNLSLTATPSNGFAFAGWIGDVVTNVNPLNVTLAESLFVQPSFVMITNSLTIVSDHGAPNPPVGTNWYAPGSLVNADVFGSPDIVGNTQYVSIGWTGTGDVPLSGAGTNTSFVISNNSSIVWNWQTQLFVNVAFDPNGSVDLASGFYLDGTNLSLTATPSNGFSFVGWTGDIVTNVNPLNVALTEALTITPMFQAVTNSLTVSSPFGTPTPAVGVTWFSQGQLVAASLAGSPAVFGSTQYVATGWTGSGSAPATGSGTTTAFSITNNSTLSWSWQTQVRLTINAAAGGGTDIGTAFKILNTNAVITAMPSPGFAFVGWTGDVPLPNVNDNPLTLLMDQARSITPTFAGAGNVKVTINPAAAVSAGAAWRLTSGPDTSWQSSGAVVSNLLTSGSPYTIVFTNLTGWTSPPSKTNVNVVAGSTTALTSEYLQGVMVMVPGGSFTMGVINGQGGVPTTVNSFFMDQAEVTVADFQAYTAANALPMPPAPSWNPGWGNTALPMVNVSWNMASAYAAWIGKRLPTEAEFEYAMRDTLPNSFYTFGNTLNPGNANFGNNVGQPTAAGSYPASANFALRDITGNVWEWCSDWYGPNLAGGNNPAGPGTGSYKIMRGGSFNTPDLFSRCAHRYYLAPTTGYFDTGFRCVVTAPPPGGAAGGAAAAASDPDADGDKVPDWWESAYFGIDASTIDGTEDSDKDGHSNAEEYAAGTDPTDAKSVFEATALEDSGSNTRVLSWKSAVGKTYRIERTSSLVEPFVPVATGITATPPVNSYPVPDSDSAGFYRIVVE